MIKRISFYLYSFFSVPFFNLEKKKRKKKETFDSQECIIIHALLA